MHRIGVWRAGTCIEHARSDAFQLLRREQGLEALTLDGRLTATLLIPDLRVDDTLEIAFTRLSHHPVLNGKFAGWLRFDVYAPWVETRQSINRPVGRTLWLKGFNEPPQPLVQIADGVERSVWTYARPKRLQPEDLQVPWNITAPCYQITEFEHWSQVAQLFAPHYRDTTLPQELIAKLDALGSQYAHPDERAVEWLRMVQSELRYFALSLGEGGLVPRPLETIWGRRFGDCKDATRLYVAGARYLGLDACAALVSTVHGFAVDSLLPGVHAFDHVIARVCLPGGATYWLDPTRRRQGGSLDNIEQFQMGWALPLVPETTGLERLPPAQPLEHLCCDESIEVGPRADSPAVVTRRVEFKYWSADELRSQLENDGASKLSAGLLQQVQESWPSAVETVPPSIEDDPVANVLTLSCTYSIKSAWQPAQGQSGRVQFVLTDNFSGGQLGAIRDGDRQAAVFLGRPRRVVWKARLRMPRQWRGQGWSRVTDEAGIRYTTELLVAADTIIATRVLTVGCWSVPAAQAQGYSRLVAEVKQNSTLLYARVVFGKIRPYVRRNWLALLTGTLGLRLALLVPVMIPAIISSCPSRTAIDLSPSATPVSVPSPAPPDELPPLDARTEAVRKANLVFSDATNSSAYLRDWLNAVQMVSLDSGKRAYLRLGELIAAPQFSQLSPPQQHAGLLLAALSGLDQRDFQSAHAYLVRSSQMSEGTVSDWSARYITARALKDWPDSVHALTVMLRRWPAAGSSVKYGEVSSLMFPLPQALKAREAAYRLAQALFAAGWKTEDGTEPAPVWEVLVKNLTERGDLNRAAGVLARIHSPRVLLSISVDRRYDALVRKYPGTFDIPDAARDQIEAYRKGTFRRPRSLDAQV